jgi:hypothetical protein
MRYASKLLQRRSPVNNAPSVIGDVLERSKAMELLERLEGVERLERCPSLRAQGPLLYCITLLHHAA